MITQFAVYLRLQVGITLAKKLASWWWRDSTHFSNLKPNKKAYSETVKALLPSRLSDRLYLARWFCDDHFALQWIMGFAHRWCHSFFLWLNIAFSSVSIIRSVCHFQLLLVFVMMHVWPLHVCFPERGCTTVSFLLSFLAQFPLGRDTVLYIHRVLATKILWIPAFSTETIEMMRTANKTMPFQVYEFCAFFLGTYETVSLKLK